MINILLLHKTPWTICIFRENEVFTAEIFLWPKKFIVFKNNLHNLGDALDKSWKLINRGFLRFAFYSPNENKLLPKTKIFSAFCFGSITF